MIPLIPFYENYNPTLTTPKVLGYAGFCYKCQYCGKIKKDYVAAYNNASKDWTLTIVTERRCRFCLKITVTLDLNHPFIKALQ